MFHSRTNSHRNYRRLLFSLVILGFLVISLQTLITQMPYFQAFAQCIDPENPRADFLITSENQSSLNKFSSRIGTCIIDSKAAIRQFLQNSYRQLYQDYYVSSKVGNKTTLTGNQTETNLNSAVSGLYLIKTNTGVSPADGNLTFNNPTAAGGSANKVVFVEGNFYIKSNYLYGDSTHGTIFVVQGDVFFDKAVTSFSGVIIAQGTICTTADLSGPAPYTCPATSVQATSPLAIDGSLVALDSAKPIQFKRKLADNSVAAEQVNQQLKYLVIFNTLFSRSSTIVSEGTSYAICTAADGKPVGCSCSVASECASNLCTAGGGSTVKICQQSANASVPAGSTPSPSASTSASPGTNPTPFPAKLVAYWKLDETDGYTATDSASTNTGSTTGTTYPPGYFGFSRKFFNGSYMTVNDSPSFGSQSITVSMWVKPYDLTTNPTAGLYSYRNGLNAYGINIQLVAGGKINCKLTINGTAGAINITSTASLTIDSWNFISCSYDKGGTGQLYVATRPAALGAAISGTVSGGGAITIPNNANVIIGKDIPSGKSFLGQIDDIRVYSYALVFADVNGLYTTPSNPGQITLQKPWKIYDTPSRLGEVTIDAP